MNQNGTLGKVGMVIRKWKGRWKCVEEIVGREYVYKKNIKNKISEVALGLGEGSMCRADR